MLGNELHSTGQSSGNTQRTGYVYVITNIVNGKRYVGQTISSIKSRWRQHKHEAKSGSRYAIHAAIRKYGPENFTITCLERINGGKPELNFAERKHIAENQSLSPFGYNLTEGGEGVDFTPEVRAKHLASVRNRSQEWQENTVKAARARATDPEWLSLTMTRLERQRSEPGWSAKAVVWAAQARAEALAKMTARDALRTPDELAKIVKRREAVSRSAALRKEPNYVHVSQAEKDSLLPSDELSRRLKHRERVQRSRAKKAKNV